MASLGKYIRCLPISERTYNKFYIKFINKLITPSGYRIKRMANAIIYGSDEVHHWVRVSWSDHYNHYKENQCFFVKYEDLLCEPGRQCERIVRFLGLERNEEQIKEAIRKQSFKNKKEEFLKRREFGKAAVMRTGKKEQWRQGLSKKTKKVFDKMLKSELSQLSYPTDSDIQ